MPEDQVSHTLFLNAGRRGPEGPRGSHSGMTGSLPGSMNSVEEGLLGWRQELRPSAFTGRIFMGRAVETSEESPSLVSGGFHRERLRK